MIQIANCTAHNPQEIQLYVNEKEIKKLLTSLLGTQIGVPSLTTPASIITPITIGSRELKTNCKA
jgi:hypothetical protein